MINSHITAESIILPAFCKIVNIMFGEEYGKDILKIRISDNTTSRRVQDMSQDAESQMLANIKGADNVAIHLNQ
jgi:hypothetical protein